MMKTPRAKLIALCPLAALLLSACAFTQGPIGNPAVPEPAKAVDLNRYLGRWYEIARYEAWFQRDCDYVTADYALKSDGDISVTNACRKGSATAPLETATATAYAVEASQNAKLRVSFFWPFYGNYWVLDHDEAYQWSIVGEPSGRFLWLLTRQPHLDPAVQQALIARMQKLGYDTSFLRLTKQ